MRRPPVHLAVSGGPRAYVVSHRTCCWLLHQRVELGLEGEELGFRCGRGLPGDASRFGDARRLFVTCRCRRAGGFEALLELGAPGRLPRRVTATFLLGLSGLEERRRVGEDPVERHLVHLLRHVRHREEAGRRLLPDLRDRPLVHRPGHHLLAHEGAILDELHRTEAREADEDFRADAGLEDQSPPFGGIVLSVLRHPRAEDVHDPLHRADPAVRQPLDGRAADGRGRRLALDELDVLQVEHPADDVEHEVRHRRRDALVDEEDANLLQRDHEREGVVVPARAGVGHLAQDAATDEPREQPAEHFVVLAEEVADVRLREHLGVGVAGYAELATDHGLFQASIDDGERLQLLLREVRGALRAEHRAVHGLAGTVDGGRVFENEVEREVFLLFARHANAAEAALIHHQPTVLFGDRTVVTQEADEFGRRGVFAIHAASRGTDGGDHLLAVLVPAFAVAGDERGFPRRELTRRV